MRSTPATAPLVCHVVHRFDVGGLENGVVNLINHLPYGAYRHAIIALTEVSDFARRLERPVSLHAMHRASGQDLRLPVRLWQLFRALRPAIVHTRNLATLESQLPAFLAGVRGRVHGEHGRDVHDLDNTRSRYRWLRRAFVPIVQQYVALSAELEHYLRHDIGVPARRIERIINGVDSVRFCPGARSQRLLAELPFNAAGRVIVGTVGRMQSVKDPMNLARAFALLAERTPDAQRRLGLVMVGDGPLRVEVDAFLRARHLDAIAWLPGARDDTPDVLRSLDVFVLPSLAEGISNTILEAMATALPVVATDVGGNSELVAQDHTGRLVTRGDADALAAALAGYVEDADSRQAHGAAGRSRVVTEFSLDTMVRRYANIYDGILSRQRLAPLSGR